MGSSGDQPGTEIRLSRMFFYAEVPVVHNLFSCKLLPTTVRKQKRVLQHMQFTLVREVGKTQKTQDRFDILFRKMKLFFEVFQIISHL